MNYKIKEFPDTMTVKIYSGEKKKSRKQITKGLL